MGETEIKAEIKKLEAKLSESKLAKRAKSGDYFRIITRWQDRIVHLCTKRGDYNPAQYLLCDVENSVSRPDGNTPSSAMCFTEGSGSFFSHTRELCPKCFKYITPSDVMRLEAVLKRKEAKKILANAKSKVHSLKLEALKLEDAALGLEKGTIQLNLTDTKFRENKSTSSDELTCLLSNQWSR